MNPGKRNLLAIVFVLVAILAGVAIGVERWAQARARQQVAELASQAAMLRAGMLDSELQKFQLLSVVVPEYPAVTQALRQPQATTIRNLNRTLSSLAARTNASAIYLIDDTGMTIAASNWDRDDSFVGQNYGFRPYYEKAMATGTAQLFALGTISGRAGLYIARRVDQGGVDQGGGRPGVLVVKVDFRAMENIWAAQPGITAVTDDNGVVIIASRQSWHFHPLAALPTDIRQAISKTRQFGSGAGTPLGLRDTGDGEIAIGKEDYIASSVPVPLLGARLINYQPMKGERRQATAIARLTFAIVFVLTLLAAGLFIRARERQSMQRAAREALEEQVAERTRELTGANEQLRLESFERARADSRYRSAREELAQANRLGSIGQITAGVAHEINQPVAAIRTFAENAGAYLDRADAGKAQGNLRHIVSLTQRIGAITSELRSFARRGTPAIGEVTLGAVIDGTLLLIGDAVQGAGIRLEQRGCDSDIKVAADRIRLEQILVNLIQNAIQALANTENAVIRIAVAEGPSIIVADNGPGIDPAIARDIFTPFVTSKPNGLGLGLGIARDIAREFGGELTVTASPLGGAAFALRLKRI